MVLRPFVSPCRPWWTLPFRLRAIATRLQNQTQAGSQPTFRGSSQRIPTVRSFCARFSDHSFANICSAQALATPVRHCAITGVRLPSYFLIGFGLAPHPKTGKPWQMPKLSIDYNVLLPSEVSSSESPLDHTATALIQEVAGFQAKPSGRTPSQTVAGRYIVNQQSATKLMCDIKRKLYLQMLPHRWKQDTRFKTDDIVLREDMDHFVLDLMRKKALRLMQYLSSKPAAYIAECQDFADAQGKHQPGAVLWLGAPGGEAQSTASERPPPPFAMLKYRSAGHIPVYNLASLLGPEYLAKLRESSRLFNNTMAVVKQKRNTLTTLMHLWQLMGYAASGPHRDIWRYKAQFSSTIRKLAISGNPSLPEFVPGLPLDPIAQDSGRLKEGSYSQSGCILPLGCRCFPRGHQQKNSLHP